MKFRAEIVVEEVLPTIRVLLATELRERGLTQQAVAAKLGLSQSAVSKYAQGQVETRDVVAQDERVQALVSELAAGLATGDVRPVHALVEIEDLLRRLSGPGDIVADLHEAAVPELQDLSYDFSEPGPDQAAIERERARSSVRRGLRVLSQSPGVATLVPHVGSNLVECLPEAGSREDVIGIPGRIRDVGGRVDVPADPDFGVSEYVGGVLIRAREAGSSARAGLNLAYSDATLAALEDAGERSVELDIGAADLESAVTAAIEAHPEATVLYHRGAVGIEPIVYLLGPSADGVARTARRVATELTES
ncbi:thiamine-phosphate synthase family protein [Halodesulfurarchaeum sp. HSR-GB]|uniref:thiamine-phosphate synthase family protein n=1 Tax=Halodesulfurarchaeum sp. HSR-GB TaxID=3074077 RepID=UPI00285DB6F6|nr:thiamine-phosphate synthase family protein [Halodesulfurarchaeum sp. HSR-GB]MDR5656744.1 thiamine-phosphate synthase family protein [Halodesulfurarchaeum sp. HSR-GB]